MAVLDVGCGWGDMSIQVAERVGPEGRVLGIDCVEAFLEEARRDAAAAGLSQVEFRRGDAEVALPESEFDYVVARFGTMFFTNPVPALRRMRLALKPDGRMTHIVWRRREDNPAWQKAKDIALAHLPAPGEDAATCGPGPFSMGDEETAGLMMKAAGYEDVDLRSRRREDHDRDDAGGMHRIRARHRPGRRSLPRSGRVVGRVEAARDRVRHARLFRDAGT